jgi:Fic family protein
MLYWEIEKKGFIIGKGLFMFVEVDYLYGKLKGIRPLSAGSVRRLSEDFLIDYTYNTNAIEGSTLTLDETALVLREGVTIGGKPLC